MEKKSVSCGGREAMKKDSGKLDPWFRSIRSIPDDWGNQVLFQWMEANGLRSHDITTVDKLAFIGKRGMGGFEFVPQMYDASSEDAVVLEELYKLAIEIESAREGIVLNLQNRPGVNELRPTKKPVISSIAKRPRQTVQWTFVLLARRA